MSYHPNSSESLNDLLSRTFKFLKAARLQPFLLTLPLHGDAAESNQQGIREKMLKNRSQVVTNFNPPDVENHENPIALDSLDQVIERLVDSNIVGFVLVVAEYIGPDREPPESDEMNAVTTAAYQYRPVSGGIVELLDEHERAIRGLWCRRSLKPRITGPLLKATTMRLIAHAFEWQHPSTTKRLNRKLLSCLELHGQTFPREMYVFLTTSAGLNLSKHWETPADGGAHNDSPHMKCKCLKLSDKEEAWQFWGISESRFVKFWTSRKDTLVPLVPPDYLMEQFAASATQAKRSSPDYGDNGSSAAAAPPPQDSSKKRQKE